MVSLKIMTRVLFSLLISIIPAVLWFCFLIFAQKETKLVSYKLLAKVFLGGLILAGTAMFIEGALAKFLPLGYLSFSKQPLFLVINFKELAFIFILTFLFIAPLEEALKYLFLKREVYKNKEVNQVIAGVQLGIILGLGFATFENAFYFAGEPNYLESIFILRLFLSTLAHVLYGGVLGYYLALAKFHGLYQTFFLKRGFITAMLLHGFFNFSLLTQAFYYTIGVVVIVFFILMKWMLDRRDFEAFILKRKSPVSAPLFAQKQEIDTFLSKEQFSFSEIKKLSFCPRCLAIKKIGQKTCPYCGMKFVE